uniref:Gp86 n=1 Tax=uncultured marine virus TaxID=186617 RepID=A0A0F7LA73_9VIRU|nr:gp86 [uncultured marine virus]
MDYPQFCPIFCGTVYIPKQHPRVWNSLRGDLLYCPPYHILCIRWGVLTYQTIEHS